MSGKGREKRIVGKDGAREGKSPILAGPARNGASHEIKIPTLAAKSAARMGHPTSIVEDELGPYSAVIPWLMAMVDEDAKWWERLRGNPKRLGEVSQAAFLLKAEMMGFSLALPWGDSERYDFVVGKAGERMLRVQVKGTGRLYRRGYEVQPVHATRGQGKRRYTKRDIDVLAGHVQPLDVWYLIPIEAVGRAKSLRFYPDVESRRPRWERWREAWDVLR